MQSWRKKVEDRTKMLREALSELERSKEELVLAFEKEKELNELKSRFVTVASHEFQNAAEHYSLIGLPIGQVQRGAS